MIRPPRQPTRFLAVCALAGLAVLSGATVRAEDYPACAKFDNPLAYNQCLAAQGPVAHGTRPIAAPPEGEDGPHRAWSAGSRGGGSAQISRSRNGRMVLELSVGAAPAGARGRKKTQ
jgi:hypothetical protein